MRPEEFCYWLQGFLEMANPKTLNAAQVQMLKAHLGLVFAHVIDPSYVAGLPPAEARAEMDRLQRLHDTGKPSAVPEDERDEDDILDDEAPALPPRPGAIAHRPRFDPDTVYKC